MLNYNKFIELLSKAKTQEEYDNTLRKAFVALSSKSSWPGEQLDREITISTPKLPLEALATINSLVQSKKRKPIAKDISVAIVIQTLNESIVNIYFTPSYLLLKSGVQQELSGFFGSISEQETYSTNGIRPLTFGEFKRIDGKDYLSIGGTSYAPTFKMTKATVVAMLYLHGLYETQRRRK